VEQPLIETGNLKKYFKTPAGFLHAVDNVNLAIYRGKTLGVVGESGCGKSTLGRTVIRLIEPTEGEVLYNGKNIYDCNKKEMMELRKELQIIFQDPYSSLNPRMTVSEIIAEPLIVNKAAKNKIPEPDIAPKSGFHQYLSPYIITGRNRLYTKRMNPPPSPANTSF